MKFVAACKRMQMRDKCVQIEKKTTVKSDKRNVTEECRKHNWTYVAVCI